MYKDLIDSTRKLKISNMKKKQILVAIKVIDSPASLKTILGKNNLINLYEISKIVGHFFAEILFDKVSKMEYKFSQKFINNFIMGGTLDHEKYLTLRSTLLAQNNYKEKRKQFF